MPLPLFLDFATTDRFRSWWSVKKKKRLA